MRYCTRCFSIIDEDSDHCEHCAAGESLTGKIISQTFVLAVLLGIALFVTNLLLGISIQFRMIISIICMNKTVKTMKHIS